MRSPTWSELWRWYVGDSESRRSVGMLVAVELAALTVGFLLQLDVLLPSPVPSLVFLGMITAPALYAGWLSAGVATGAGGVWLPLAWDAIVPPLVGYVVGSNAARFAHPRLLAFEYVTPRGELVGGIETAFTTLVLLAALLGSVLYVAGLIGKKLRMGLFDEG